MMMKPRLFVAMLAGALFLGTACAGDQAAAPGRGHANPSQDAVGNKVSADPKLNRQFQ